MQTDFIVWMCMSGRIHQPPFALLQASPLAPQSPLPSPPEMSPAPSPVEGWNQYSDMAGAFSLQWQVVDDIITFIISAGVQGVHSSLSLSLSACVCMCMCSRVPARIGHGICHPNAPQKRERDLDLLRCACKRRNAQAGVGWRKGHGENGWLPMKLASGCCSGLHKALCQFSSAFLSRPKMHCN